MGNGKGVNRRDLLKASFLAGTTKIMGFPTLALAKKTRQSTTESSFFGHKPFSQELFVPKIMQSKPKGTLDPPPGHYPGARYQGQPWGPAYRTTRSADRINGFNEVSHGIAQEFVKGNVDGFPCEDWNSANDSRPEHEKTVYEKEYKLLTEETTHQFFPGVYTPIFVYRDAFAENPNLPGNTPGPTGVVRFRSPVVLRNENHLTADRHPVNSTHHDVETSLHIHGTHAPAHADGYPDFYVLAGEARDYFLPNIAPRKTNPLSGLAPTCHGEFDQTWKGSTLWYHDHAMDVTGFNVSRGLAGFYLEFDAEELALISNKILPPPGKSALESLGVPGIDDMLQGHDEGFDFGLAIQDQRFNSDGSLSYDFMDHNGRLGDIFTVNGVVQPFMNVKRGKYRFRILNGSNARMYRLRLSTRAPFLVFGADSWLFPYADFVDTFELAPGQRHDVIIDFSDYPPGTHVRLENIMIQTDGRKGKKIDHSNPTPLLEFRVQPEVAPYSWTIHQGTTIRQHWQAIDLKGNEPRREFVFDRSLGAFTVNNRFFNPRRTDAVPLLGSTEKWIFENKAGGWWHPIHPHLEGFQIRTLNGKKPPFERSFNSDLVNLHGGEVAEVAIKFRTFTGPFAFHCHTIEHEDMRMMGVHDPQPDGISPLDGEKPIDPNVSGVVPSCDELETEGRIYFDEVGDIDRVADRGVGFEHCEFDIEQRGNQ